MKRKRSKVSQTILRSVFVTPKACCCSQGGRLSDPERDFARKGLDSYAKQTQEGERVPAPIRFSWLWKMRRLTGSQNGGQVARSSYLRPFRVVFRNVKVGRFILIYCPHTRKRLFVPNSEFTRDLRARLKTPASHARRVRLTERQSYVEYVWAYFARGRGQTENNKERETRDRNFCRRRPYQARLLRGRML